MKQDIINFLSNKKILIIGFGREGKSAFEFIKENVNYSELAVADKNNIQIDNIKTYTGDNYLESTKDYDIVIKSPGIIIKDYISDKEKEKITSLTDLFLRFCPNKIIGITGTKGKSTTSSLIYHILKENNYDTYLIGNIGIPCFDVIDLIKENTILVYELSCHQLEFVKASPDISVLLNLYEEHLDFFNSKEDYFLAKMNMFKFMNASDYGLYTSDSDILNSYVKNNNYNCNLFDISKEMSIRDGYVYIGDKKIYNTCDERSLLGKHNLVDIEFVLYLSELLNLDLNKTIVSINEFKSLEHRL